MIARGFKAFAIGLILVLNAATAATPFCPRDAKLYRLGQSYFTGGQYLLSAIQFSAASLSDCEETLGVKSKYALALSLMELGEVELGIENLKSLSGSRMDAPAKLYLATLDPTFESVLTPPEKTRARLWQNRERPEKFTEELTNFKGPEVDRKELIRLQELMQLSPTRSPAAAGIASAVLPGLGQAYSGSWQAAGIALVLNAIFLATTVEFARHDQWAATAASGLVFSVTYVGNILNAIAAAQAVNKANALPHERKLKEKLFPEFIP